MGQKFGAVACIVFLGLAGCLSPPQESSADFRIATTTSLRDSGLLDVLIEEFTSLHDVEVEYITVGTGAALNLGVNRDVDALIVHAPDQELAFLDQGHGSNRTQIAWNAFVLLSPVELSEDLDDAFLSIVESEQCFISRGDDSGTHLKEQEIWRRLNTTANLPVFLDSNGYHPSGDWYFSIGQGMGAAINMAHEKNCITFSDRGTALEFQNKISLQRFEYDDVMMHNPYSFISVTGGNEAMSALFLSYLLNEGKATIASYTINGEPAYFV
jgi:tungstate transport system substrate-binding protein